MAEEEEWRPVSGYEGLYEVSSLGRVRSLDRWAQITPSCRCKPYRRFTPGKELKSAPHTSGYRSVCLWREGVQETALVHRLVCRAFHGEPPVGAEAAHGDGSKRNNQSKNLRWASRSENQGDSFIHGTKPLGERHRNSKLTAMNVRAIRTDRIARLIDLAERFGVSISLISQVRHRKIWRHID
jgi:hypothetical protein